MAGPWEQYQNTSPTPQTTPEQNTPWSNYQDPGLPQVDVLQEQSPEVGFQDRFVAKNFGNSPEAQAAYIKQQHPDLLVEVRDGQVVAKKPGEVSFRALDPSGPDLQDISDLAYDVPAGMATGVATAAGGVAGAPAGGIGALPSAALAGSATSSGLEALRQKLGQYFGIPQEMDYGQVATQGVAGAVAPVVFGTGASAGQMLKAGLTEAEKQAQRSMVTRGVQKALPKIAESTSGVPESAIKTLYNRGDEVSQLREGGITEPAEAVYTKIKEGVNSKKAQIGQGLQKEIEKTPKLVDIRGAKSAVDNQILKLENSSLKNNPEIIEKIAELKAARKQIFGQVTGEVDEAGNAIIADMPDVVDAKTAFELQDLLKQQGDLGKIKSGLKGRFSSTDTKASKEWGAANLEAYKSINQGLDTATEGMSTKFKNDYRSYIQLQNDLDKYFKTPEKTVQTLQSLNSPGKQMLKEKLEHLKANDGVDIKKEAELFEAYKYFNKPSLLPLSSGGTTSTSRTGLLGTLGYLAGHNLTGSYQGGLAGATGANYLGGPRAVMYGTQLLSGAEKRLAPYAPYIAPLPARGGMSVWDSMQER